MSTGPQAVAETTAGRNHSLPYTGLVLLCLIGIFFSTILLYHHTELSAGFQVGPSSCSISAAFDCDAVARSSFATWFGVPVAGFSLCFYFALLCIAVIVPRPNETQHTESQSDRQAATAASERSVWSFFFLLSLIGGIAALILLAISILKIGTVCLYCLALDLVSFSLLIVTTIAVKRWGSLAEALVEAQRVLSIILKSIVPQRSLSYSQAAIRAGLLATALLFLAVILLPRFLILEIFLPRARVQQDSSVAEQLYKSWLEVPPVDIALDDSDSTESKDYVLGARDASITIVEFSDFECPFCRMAASELEKLLAENPTVRIVFKNFPLDRSCNRSMQRDLHKFACTAAFAARCAGEQGDAAFSRAYKQLFSFSSISDSAISGLPAHAGLKSKEFNDCLESRRTEQRVAKDIEEGIRLGIQGTPTLFINGKRLPKWHIGTLQLIVKRLAARNAAPAKHAS